jgi:pimeloyl-ACP methyl ester carboxylesterase
MRRVCLAAIAACALVAGAAPQGEAWQDPSPHKSGFCRSNGVRLQFLDWGGRGEAIVLLHGLGTSPHIFDELAPRLADGFRVVGLARRGHGQSDKPATGYDIGTLVEDIRRLLDAKGIRRASLVGHSFAGLEMTEFAIRHPDRVRKLVYLDATFDRSALAKLAASAPPMPAPGPGDMSSMDAMREWSRRMCCPVWTQSWEAELRHSSRWSRDGRYEGEEMPKHVEDALMRLAREARPDYSRVKSPALAFFASYDEYPARFLPPDAGGDVREAAARYQRDVKEAKISDAGFVRRNLAGATVVELRDADHYFFIGREVEIAGRIRAFLLAD